MVPDFPRIQAASVDGRLHNVYHRQVQVEKLCKALTDNFQEIKATIATDYGYSAAEIAVEYHLALNEVKRVYSTLEPKECHDEEYRIFNDKDAPEARKPAGIVYIEPTQHNLFYSTVVPLSAALFAGNCVIVLLENNLRAVTSLLRKILPSALDADVFAVASSPITDSSFLAQAICVLQNGILDKSRSNQLSFDPNCPVVAIVDRTADVQLAARELVTARFSFGGNSPYAPDCVLVNEFTKEEFLKAVKSEWIRLGSSNIKANIKSRIDEQLGSLHKVDNQVRTIIQESNLAVVDLSSRKATLQIKTNVPILKIHGVKSLDDAIDLVNGYSTDRPCLAAYHFGNLATGKYLSQFIDAQVSFINHVPREILVGPAAPSGHPVQPANRYPMELFTIPRPAYVHASDVSNTLAKVLDAEGGSSAQKLLADAAIPLVVSKRHPGGGVGFFEQGFLINAGIIVVSTLTASATGALWLWKWSRAL